MRATGAFALIDSLKRHGVEHIFGYPGGAILPIYDELYRAEEAGGIHHISWCATSKLHPMLQMPTPDPREKLGFVLGPPVLEPPTSSLASRPPIWIPFPWSSLQGK